MAVKVRQNQRATIYFVTFTCHKWLPLFEETKLYDNIYNWFNLLIEKDIKIVGYVLLPNHSHCMLYLPKEAPELYKIISNSLFVDSNHNDEIYVCNVKFSTKTIINTVVINMIKWD